MKRFILLMIIVLSSSLVYSYDFSHSTKINVGTSSSSRGGGSDHSYSSGTSGQCRGNDYSYSPYIFSDHSAGHRNAASYKISINGPVDPLYGISLNQVQHTCSSIYYDSGGQGQLLPLEIIFEDQIKSGALLYKGNDIHAYNELIQLNDIVSHQRKLPEFSGYKDFLNNQLYAINDTLNMHFAFQQKHTVTPEVKAFFKQYKYDASFLDRPYYATRLQYYLHEQCLSIFDTVAHAQLASSFRELQPMYSIIADLGWSALSYNVAGKVKTASQLIQGCLLLLDTTSFVAQKSVESLCVLGNGVWQTAYHVHNGVHQGLDNVAAVICDPLQFLANCAQAITVVSDGMVQAVALGSRCSLAMDIAISDPDNAILLLKEISAQVEPIKEYIDASALQLANMPAGKILEATVAFTVEGVAWGAIRRLCKFTVKNIPVMTQAIRDSVAVSEIAMTAEGIPVRVFAPKMFECMEEVNAIKNAMVPGKIASEINAAKIWASSKEFTQLNKKIEKLKNIARDTKIISLINTDTPINKIMKIEEEAGIFYNAMRKTNIDVKKISTNTGIPQKTIQKIKNHLFKENHLLKNTIAKFDPDPDIAKAWERLIGGSFFQADLKLLQHEYAELLIMQGEVIGYDIAHPLANSTYDWQSGLL